MGKRACNFRNDVFEIFQELKAWISWYLATHGTLPSTESVLLQGEEKTKEMLDNMKEMGFSWATRAGISLGVDDPWPFEFLTSRMRI